MQGLIGRKAGMTQVYDAKGKRVAVTVIEAGPCYVVQRKTAGQDGYEAAQIGFVNQKEQRMTKPAVAHLKKAGVPLVSHLREVGLDAGDEVKAGDTINVSMFEGVGFVDVIGTTKGRGFQGVVRRHQMAGGPKTHGGHSKRRIGAIGQRALSARVHKGHRMPGHMGHVRATQQNLRVVEVRATENLLLVQGSIPGPTGAVVLVRKALKKK